MTKVAINGFGRIGRNVFRVILEREDPGIEIVAINDLADDDILAYLLEYDSVMGHLDVSPVVENGSMRVGPHNVAMLMERDPAALPWAELGVDIVIEATGVFRDRASLQKHLDAGAKRVILTVPPKDAIDEMVVLGVNDEELDESDIIVSNASCTTNCLAPVAKVLDDAFGLKRGVMTRSMPTPTTSASPTSLTRTCVEAGRPPRTSSPPPRERQKRWARSCPSWPAGSTGWQCVCRFRMDRPWTWWWSWSGT